MDTTPTRLGPTNFAEFDSGASRALFGRSDTRELSRSILAVSVDRRLSKMSVAFAAGPKSRPPTTPQQIQKVTVYFRFSVLALTDSVSCFDRCWMKILTLSR